MLIAVIVLMLVVAVGPHIRPWRRLLDWLGTTYVACNVVGAALFGVAVGTWVAVGFRVTWQAAMFTTVTCGLFAFDDWRRRRPQS